MYDLLGASFDLLGKDGLSNLWCDSCSATLDGARNDRVLAPIALLGCKGNLPILRKIDF